MNEYRCENCGKKIEKDTVWCQYCGAEQHPRYSIYGTLVILLIIAGMVMYEIYKYKESKEPKIEPEPQVEENQYSKIRKDKIWYKIEHEDITIYNYTIEGSILNQNEVPLKNVTIYFDCYGSANNKLGTISSSVDEIDAEGMWYFSVTYNGKADRCEYQSIVIGR